MNELTVKTIVTTGHKYKALQTIIKDAQSEDLTLEHIIDAEKIIDEVAWIGCEYDEVESTLIDMFFQQIGASS